MSRKRWTMDEVKAAGAFPLRDASGCFLGEPKPCGKYLRTIKPYGHMVCCSEPATLALVSFGPNGEQVVGWARCARHTRDVERHLAPSKPGWFRRWMTASEVPHA